MNIKNCKQTAMLIGMGRVEGKIEAWMDANGENLDPKEHFWVSLVWINDWYYGYYLGYDVDRNCFIVEHRKMESSDEEDNQKRMEKTTVIELNPPYMEDGAVMLYKAIKYHKEALK